MIVEYPIEKGIDLLPIFEKNTHLHMLIEGLLREKTGIAYVNSRENPISVVLSRRDIIYFLAGNLEEESVPELLDMIPERRLIFVPNEDWTRKLEEHFGEKLKAYPRTKFSSDMLDIKQMQEIQKKLPERLDLRKITKETIDNISDQAKRIISILFPTQTNFIERNFGFGIFDGEKIISLALAASPLYNNHFEIHIETDPKYQRKGLATIVCARLIEYSLQKNLVPHWDADNEPSAKLALKLGFSNPETYNAYFWIKNE